MTVFGSNLDSVAAPQITITVVITRYDSDTNVTSSVTYTKSEVITLFSIVLLYLLR